MKFKYNKDIYFTTDDFEFKIYHRGELIFFGRIQEYNLNILSTVIKPLLREKKLKKIQ